MGKRILIVMLVLIVTGCVKTEILEGPEKTKTITVWDSDLKLHYDRLTDNRRTSKEEAQLEEVFIPEEQAAGEVAEEGQVRELPEVDLSIIEEGIAGDLKDKQAMDERESKKIGADEIEAEKIEERGGRGGAKWLTVLAGLAFFGGCFTSVKRRGK